jgi:DNA-binding SARP family transcriptional activator
MRRDLGDLAALSDIGDSAGCLRLLTEHGRELLAAGGAATIVTVVPQLLTDTSPAELLLVYADALGHCGEPDAAIGVYERLAAGRSTLDPALAWRFGLIYYLRGEPERALEIYSHGLLMGERTVDEALLLAWTATAYWMIGDGTGCAEFADRARQAAVAADDQGAQAAAHIALALHASLTGDLGGNQEYYDRALQLAEAAGDAMQATRIHANRAACLLDEGRYAQALKEARTAVAHAERNGFAAFLGTALVNEGEALGWLGRLEEAVARYERAVPIFHRMGSRKAAYPLLGLGEVYRRWGRRQQARAAFERALRVLGADRNLQVLVPALTGLARTLAATEPDVAAELVAQALAVAIGPTTTVTQLAVGALALGRDDRAAAARAADAAAESARLHGDSAGLAQSLELAAGASDDPKRARTALAEARFIYAERGARLDVERVRLALGQLADATSAEQIEGRVAAQKLLSAGVVLSPFRERSAVTIVTLGRFDVLVAGVSVPSSAWQSRKARDLLRILLSRRGRAVPREELAELLWPGEDSGKTTANRLSVALSTVRTVLDPYRRSPPDHFLFADQACVGLNLARTEVDAYEFAAEAEHGLRLLRQGGQDARAVLISAEQRYHGDFLGDEPYHEWSVPLREELRALYLRATYELVTLLLAAGENAEAARYFHRILDMDPYDERSHLALIRLHLRSGRHGEARRAYQRYGEAMLAVGIPARLWAEILAQHPGLQRPGHS